MSVYDFGSRLRKLRELHNLSQEEMGRRVGRSKPVISNYENNLKYPSLDILTNIAALYNVSLDYLVGIDKKEMVSIDGLSDSEKEIIHSILLEFRNKQTAELGLSENQQNIINLLMKEFSKKNYNRP